MRQTSTSPAPSPARAQTMGAALMVLAGVAFAGVNTLLQYGSMRLQIAPSTLAFWQYAIAFLFVFATLFKGGLGVLRTRHLRLHLLRLVISVISVQLWAYGLAHVPIWQAIALILLSPFFVTIGARIFLHETVGLERWLACLIGAAGGLVILQPWSDAFTLWALFPVGAALCWAIVSLLTKKISGDEDPRTITLWLLLLLTPANFVLAWPEGFALESGTTALVVLGLGLGTALAQFAISKAYSLADAAFLQPFDHLKLPLNVGLGFLVFGWAPPGSMWLGAALIIAASLWLLRREGQATR